MHIPQSQHFVSHAALVGVLTFFSRITGLLRDATLAAVFGLGHISDAFFIGFLVPNLFRRLFGEGALTAAFIPHYSELLENDPALARRFASAGIALLIIVCCGLTLIGEAMLVALLAAFDCSEQTSLAIRLTMVMLPYMPLICLVALIGGLLQVHRKFGPPAAAPIILNLTMIAAAVPTGLIVSPGHDLGNAAFIIAVSVLLAGILQLTWQIAAMLRCTSLTTHFTGAGEPLGRMFRMMLPMLIGLAVFQINALLDSLIAFGLSPKNGAAPFTLLGLTVDYPIQQGAVAALQWSQRLYQFPLGVFGLAIATAIFPALSQAAADTSVSGRDQFRRTLQKGLRLTVFIGLPASLGLIVVRLPLSRVIYERGQFTLDDAVRVATILAGYASAIWAYSMTHVLTRSFYAHKNAHTPLKISLVVVAINLMLNLVLIWPLGAAGLAWSTAISAAVQVVLLLIAVRKYVDNPIDRPTRQSWLRSLTLSIIMAAAIMPVILFVDLKSAGLWSAAAWLTVMVAGGIFLYLAGAAFFRSEELKLLSGSKNRI